MLNDFITLKGEEIPIKIDYLPQNELKFYPDNPRIYSIICTSENEPDQQEIEETLLKRENVKHLIQAIKSNGGLTDPIFVKGDNLVVIEGNSRLAAYRALFKQDPVRWAKIKCKILPNGINDDLIFSLLGEYHIIGKQDWIPYEQAGYLHRRHKKHGISSQQMAESLGISVKQVNHLIEVYDFMIKHNDNNPTRWSYYDEYLKKNIIKKARKEFPTLDRVVVKKIKSGEIPKAVEIRDELPMLIKGGKKILSLFVEEKKSFSDCIDKAKTKGADEHCLQKIISFKNWIVDNDIVDSISDMEVEARKKTLYELTKIQKRINYIVCKISNP